MFRGLGFSGLGFRGLRFRVCIVVCIFCYSTMLLLVLLLLYSIDVGTIAIKTLLTTVDGGNLSPP